MDKLIERVEQMIEKQFEAFEEKPVKTSLKFLVILWILKMIYKEIKK